jgi:hypothetical protein
VNHLGRAAHLDLPLLLLLSLPAGADQAAVAQLAKALVANRTLVNFATSYSELCSATSAALMRALAQKAGLPQGGGAEAPLALVHHPRWPGVVSLDGLQLHFVTSSSGGSGSGRPWRETWAGQMGILEDWQLLLAEESEEGQAGGSSSTSGSSGDLGAGGRSDGGGSGHGSSLPDVAAADAQPSGPLHSATPLLLVQQGQQQGQRRDQDRPQQQRAMSKQQQHWRGGSAAAGHPKPAAQLRMFLLCPGGLGKAIADAVRHMPAISRVSCR